MLNTIGVLVTCVCVEFYKLLEQIFLEQLRYCSDLVAL